MSAAVPSPHRLVIRRELRLVKRVALDPNCEGMLIGNTAAADVRLEHSNISARHAVIEPVPSGWRIRAVGANVTFRVNGRKAAEAELLEGDVIDVRPFTITYLGPERDRAARTHTSGDGSLHLADENAVTTYARDASDPVTVIRQRLDDLYALARLILSRKDNGAFWQIMHAALQRCLTADRCVIVGVDETDGLFRLAPRARIAADAPLGVSRSVLYDVIEAGQGMLVENVGTDVRYAEAQSLVDHRSGSVICVPVIVEGTTRAVLYADRMKARVPFNPEDLNFAIAAIDLAVSAVSMDELSEQSRELSHLKGRIDAGRDMQKLLLPDPIPQPEWGNVAAINIPAEQMSGDIYDVIIDRQGRLVVSLADISGKGVPAAFGTAVLQTSLRQALTDHDDLQTVMRSLNATLSHSLPGGCFATMVVCRFAPGGGSVEIANAGHHAPLWRRNDQSILAYPERVAIAVGIMPEWDDEIIVKELKKETGLLLSSDGVTEAINDDDEEYGLDRLQACYAEAPNRQPTAVLQHVIEDISAFSADRAQRDDLTMLAVSW